MKKKLLQLTLLLIVSGAAWADPRIPPLQPDTPFSEWVESFHAQPPTECGLDSCLPVVFHGSSASFERVKPYPSKRGTPTLTRWQGTAIFATADPRVALFYTYQRQVPNFHCGLNLIDYTPPSLPVTYYLTGGESLQEALDTLFGRLDQPDSCRGFIYVLSKQYFYREPGIGTMECITRDPAANLWRIEVNRRRELDALVASGRVRLDWK